MKYGEGIGELYNMTTRRTIKFEDEQTVIGEDAHSEESFETEEKKIKEKEFIF